MIGFIERYKTERGLGRGKGGYIQLFKEDANKVATIDWCKNYSWMENVSKIFQANQGAICPSAFPGARAVDEKQYIKRIDMSQARACDMPQVRFNAYFTYNVLRNKQYRIHIKHQETIREM